MPVKKGDYVKVDYEGKLDNGEVFDSSDGSEPLEFQAGAGNVIKGFDAAVIGMEKGDVKDVSIPASEAYGEVREDLIQDIPRSEIPASVEPQEGMMIAIGLDDGTQLPATVTKVTQDSVTIDMNHPLAGKALNFKVKVLDYIRQA